MKLLDRYIVRQFLVNFAILLAVLMLLFIVIDLIVDLDEFLEAGRVRAQRYGGLVPGTVVAIVDYYGPVLLLLFVYFSGLLVAAAAGFAFTGLQRSRELVAVIASGVSLYRVAAPAVVVGIALNALALPIQELLIPELAPKLARSKSEVKLERIGLFEVRYAPDSSGALLSAASFDPVAGRLTGVSILERSERGLADRWTRADQAFWDAEQGGWRLFPEGYAVRPGQPEDAWQNPERSDPEPVSFFPSDLSPTVLTLRQATDYPALLSMSRLRSLQHNEAVEPRQRAQIARIIWGRFSLLIVNVLIMVMALPFFLTRLVGQNPLVAAVKAAAICLTAWGAALVVLQLQTDAINPVAVAWLPVVVLLPISAALLQGIRT